MSRRQEVASIARPSQYLKRATLLELVEHLFDARETRLRDRQVVVERGLHEKRKSKRDVA